MDSDGLDQWIDKMEQKHFKSITSQDQITRQCLKERILELQEKRDKIMYELDRLKFLVDGMRF